MLAAFVGEETFLKGVSIYLKQRLYGNSVTNDLWDGISEAVKDTSGLNVAQFMENWTSKVKQFCSRTLHTLMQTDWIPRPPSHRDTYRDYYSPGSFPRDQRRQTRGE